MTRIAVQQLAPAVGDLEANRRLSVDAIREAAGAGAEVVVLPELITSGYRFEDAADTAEVGLIVADVDLAATRDKQLTDLAHAFGDRRPEMYGSVAG
jgi:hypothetical protein